jgi:hypothetical protein
MTAGTGWVAFDDLPLLGDTGIRSSWGVFGAGDMLGSLNFITAEIRAAALAAPSAGQAVNVSLPLTEPSPPMYGRGAYEQVILPMNTNANDDYVDNFYLQASTQWDGLRHVGCPGHGFYGGYQGEFTAADTGTLGIQHWASAGIIGRGVLVDLPRYHARHDLPYAADGGTPVPASVVAAAASDGGVQFRPGDILCLKFGWPDSYLGLPPGDRAEAAIRGQFTGLSAEEETARFLWDTRIAAVAADNPALEVVPGDPANGSLHRRLIPALGFAVGELFDFRELSQACAAANRWDFLFVSVPLNLPGGVGSPGNAIAVI